MFSKALIYGIQAMIFLAQKSNQDRAYTPVSEIAQSLNIPFQFLKKIIQTLGEEGLLVTQRSAKGGVALARAAENITVFDVIKAIDGGEMFESECILKFPGCGNEKPCPMHHHWAIERVRLKAMFENTHLAVLATNVAEGLTRLGVPSVAEE
jgi:Rrf2 family protein